MKYVGIAAFFSLLVHTVAQGYIYELTVLRRWDDVQRAYQYVIGMSDFHDKFNDANKTQREFLRNLFKRCSQSRPRVIVEDISSEGAQGRICCGCFYVDSKDGILGGITSDCRQCGVFDVDNVEYRYCRVFALAPIIHAHSRDLSTLISSNQISISALAEEIGFMINEASGYNDGAELNSHYTKTIAAVQKDLKDLGIHEMHDASVVEYILKHKTRDRMELVKRLLTFDSALLDLKMLHHIHASHEKNTIIGIAGGAHISRVCDVLKTIGYELVYTNEVTMTRETDPNKCIGCPLVNDRYCLKPLPIDLSVVNDYL